MTEQPARQLVGTSWVVARTGLSRAAVKRGARDGRIPASKLLDVWRFCPEQINAWIAAGSNQQPKGMATELAAGSTHPSPAADHQRGRATNPTPESTPPLMVIFPDAPWRGINDQPSETTARPAGRQRARTKKTALSV